jgi:pantoate--beta-alanine ligase
VKPAVVRTASDLRRHMQAWKEEGLTVGFVPTMGALHAGHLSLVNIALENARRCLVSVFVNPAQFAPHEDFDSYPRDEDSDIEQLGETGAHLVYLPPTAEIYPAGMESPLKAGAAAQGLESDFRPHFFDGVANVVARLFDHVRPDLAVFGEKDYQQLQVIREMVAAQDMPVRIIGGPIIRDEEGLALSSRNAYLSEQELKIARRLNRILFETAAGISGSLRTADTAIHSHSGLPRRADALLAMTDEAKNELLVAGFDKVDYVAARWNRLLAAAWIGKTRLIDNVPAEV